MPHPETPARSWRERLILMAFFTSVTGLYLLLKYPEWLLTPQQITSWLYLGGKSTSFWYATVYTAVVCGLAGWIIIRRRSPYSPGGALLSTYQRRKFMSIFISQLLFFYLIPFIIPAYLADRPFFADPYEPLNKDAYVYVFNGFKSAGGFIYIFILVPATVWWFGKRYCSWFCACGNLAEVIGATPWGNRLVKNYTPRSARARRLEWLQYGFLGFAVLFGLVMFSHSWQIIQAETLVQSLREIQDLCVDFMFGALIGIGAYPILGTRIWCRYGCPLAGLMRLFGKFTRSRFAVVAGRSCQGLGLCSTQCPMGIDVASYAHAHGRPIEGSVTLQTSPCIGCGGCVDICPVKALKFKQILGPPDHRLPAKTSTT